jgi:hypothetical protein
MRPTWHIQTLWSGVKFVVYVVPATGVLTPAFAEH